MDQHSLRRLADEGLAAFPPHGLRTAADHCWDVCETTGDARYCSLWRTLDLLALPFEDEGGPSPAVDVIDRIDDVLRGQLRGVLDAPSAEAGSLLGRRLREDVLDAVNWNPSS